MCGGLKCTTRRAVACSQPSVSTRSGKYRPGSKSLHACTRAQRILSDLTGVLATSRRRPVVLAGDFNLTTQGAKQSAYKDASNAAAAVFARLEAWGMVDCLKHTRPADAPRLADW